MLKDWARGKIMKWIHSWWIHYTKCFKNSFGINLYYFHYYCYSYLGPLKTDVLIFFLKASQYQFRVEGPTKHSDHLCPLFLSPRQSDYRNEMVSTSGSGTISGPLTLWPWASPSHAAAVWRGRGAWRQINKGLVRLGLALGSTEGSRHVRCNTVSLSAFFWWEGKRHRSLGPYKCTWANNS